jgi:hypothetical protein
VGAALEDGGIRVVDGEQCEVARFHDGDSWEDGEAVGDGGHE